MYDSANRGFTLKNPPTCDMFLRVDHYEWVICYCEIEARYDGLLGLSIGLRRIDLLY